MMLQSFIAVSFMSSCIRLTRLTSSLIQETINEGRDDIVMFILCNSGWYR